MSYFESEAITVANRGLPNALEAKRTPVGSEALSYFVEAGYDVASLVGSDSSIIPFVKYDFVDSMHKTEGVVVDDDRYERSTITAGVDYFLTPEIVFKADYSRTSFGADSKIEDLDNFTLAMGYQF